MTKIKIPNWFPTVVHKSWYTLGCHAFDETVLEHVKKELIKQWPFLPDSQDIFKDFAIPVEAIQMVLVSEQWPMYGNPHPKVQQDIWQILEVSEGWDDADNYCASNMSDLPNCLKLTLNRTNKTNVWGEFNDLLFEYFGELTYRWLFVAMDETSFDYCKKLKDSKHEVHYGFDPEAIREWFKYNFNQRIDFGLPF